MVTLGAPPIKTVRADVAAGLWTQFQTSGWSQAVSGQAPAPYLNLTWAHSTVDGSYVGATRTIYVDSPTLPLTIDRQGAGTGAIAAAGLACPGGSGTQGQPCGAAYPLSTVVTLSAVPDVDATFGGWSGACSGVGACQVTLTAAKFVVATFSKIPTSYHTTYYHTDLVGSVRAITDETGATVIRHDYAAFGEDTQPLTGDPLRFGGKQLDPETANEYFEARYLRTNWGRFLTPDPMDGNPADPQSWNRYAYARNNPLAFVDPTGLAYDAWVREDLTSFHFDIWHFDDDADFWTWIRGNYFSWGGNEYGHGELYDRFLNEIGDFDYSGPVPGGPSQTDPGDGGGGGGGGANQPPCPSCQPPPPNPGPPLPPNPPPPGCTSGCGPTPPDQPNPPEKKSDPKPPTCFSVFIDTFWETISPLDPDWKAGTVKAGATFAQMYEFNSALKYAAENGLTYPNRSSVFRGVLKTAKWFGEAAEAADSLILLDVGLVRGAVNEAIQGYRYQCRP
jgi:RHS repeat-associated protein